MSTSHATTEPKSRNREPSPAGRALAYWATRIQRLPPAAEDAARVLAHARQALQLAARQGADAASLARLAQHLHGPLMSRGLVRTWAHDLQALLDLRPDVFEHTPALGDSLLSAWTAAGEWQRVQEVLSTFQHAAAERRPLAAQLLHRHGSLLWMQGHWSAALRLAQQAWRLTPPELPDLRIAITGLLLLATWRLGRRKHARRWGLRGLALCAADQHLWRGRLHHYLLLTALPHDLTAASRHLRLAEAHLSTAQAHLQLAHLWADATDLYLAQGQPDRAEEALLRAYTLWREIEDPAGLADYYRHAAVVAFALGRTRVAREYAAHAAERWRALGVTAEVRRCQALLHGPKAPSPNAP